MTKEVTETERKLRMMSGNENFGNINQIEEMYEVEQGNDKLIEYGKCRTYLVKCIQYIYIYKYYIF